jgi:L-ascorbate metabolism protein UlaG (beta-lactamase superfamily)
MLAMSNKEKEKGKEKEKDLTALYIGGPTALFEWGDFRLLTDPTFDGPGCEYKNGPVVLEKTAGPALSSDALGPVDMVLLSHDHHFDNLDHAGRQYLSQAKRVITTTEGAARLAGNAIGLLPWQSVNIPGNDGQVLRITGAPAQHGPAHNNRGPVTGFVASLADEPDRAIYFSGDTVWFDGVAEVARRFPVRTAVLFMGAATVPAVGPFALTMTAEDGVQAARAFSQATIVPVHFEDWKHFSESRKVISRAFRAAGIEGRLHWMQRGTRQTIS